MKKKSLFKVCVATICMLFVVNGSPAFAADTAGLPGDLTMWYNRPAGKWMEALPIGNGRLGAMVYGGVQTERLALNESTMWSGEEDPNQNKIFGREMLDALRKLFFEGKLIEGNSIAWDNLVGIPHSFGTHLPIGDLKLDFKHSGEMTGYHHALDLETAVGEVDYVADGVRYHREYFASNPDHTLVYRLTADRKKSITFDVSLDMIREAQIKVEEQQLVFDGQALFPMHGTGGVHFEGRIAVVNEGGSVKNGTERLTVENADAVTLIVDVRTDFKNPDYRQTCIASVNGAVSKSYKKLKQVHVADYSRLFGRVGLHLGDGNNTLPTDVRREQAKEGRKDVALDALYFQFGRYLTIASSREDSPLPIALQGFFNDNKACTMPWTNDYHLDMNTQQNYWVANIGNLAECNIPLFNYIKDLAEHGKKTAEVVYGCKGWTAHTTANAWGYTAPSNCILWGLFPTASSWIAAHLWTEYEYTQDKDFLARTAYPLLKGNADFLLDYMVEDPRNGYLVTSPVCPEEMPVAVPVHKKEVCAADKEWADRIYQVVNDNLMDESFNVEAMADILCMSRSTLLRRFKQTFDSSPVELIRMLRLNKAAELIGEGRYRISDIGYMVGFSSASYFSKNFQKQFGMAPKDYAKHCRDAKVKIDAASHFRVPEPSKE